jgi:hypothetical protein
LVCANVAEIHFRRRTGNEEVIAWLETSSEYARHWNEVRLARMLESVRAEAVKEAELAKRRGPSTGDAPGCTWFVTCR